MWISTILSFVLSACSFPFIIALCKRWQIYDPTSVRKIHSGNIPRLGGRSGGLPVLAEADFCIEGSIIPGVQKPEGPFGDHLGYYSLAHDFPVMRVKRVHQLNTEKRIFLLL